MLLYFASQIGTSMYGSGLDVSKLSLQFHLNFGDMNTSPTPEVVSWTRILISLGFTTSTGY